MCACMRACVHNKPTNTFKDRVWWQKVLKYFNGVSVL